MCIRDRPWATTKPSDPDHVAPSREIDCVTVSISTGTAAPSGLVIFKLPTVSGVEPDSTYKTYVPGWQTTVSLAGLVSVGASENERRSAVPKPTNDAMAARTPTINSGMASAKRGPGSLGLAGDPGMALIPRRVYGSIVRNLSSAAPPRQRASCSAQP